MNKRPRLASISEEHFRDDAESEVDDRTLVERSQRGDRDAFRQLYSRYHRRAYALAFGVVHDQDDALDVVQEAFLKAHRSLGGFEGNASFYTWLYRIVMNVAIDHIRKEGRAQKVEFDDAIGHSDEDAPPGTESLAPTLLGFDPATELQRKDVRDKIDQALARLSPNHRAVLIMREVDGLSYEEMAKAMKCSKGTIMSRLFHARRNMQKHLLALFGGQKDLEV